VKLFGTPETTDDLGMGQLRDAISNSLFPGTSVLHLGARYMLLVPWAYQTAHRSTRNPEDLRKRSEESERQLIGRLKEIGEGSYIGRDAGRNVQLLPSAAYWTALRTYGIVNPDTDRSAVAQLMCTAATALKTAKTATRSGTRPIPESSESGQSDVDESGLQRVADDLISLHAMANFCDFDHHTYALLGSANAAEAGFTRNLEFLLETLGAKSAWVPTASGKASRTFPSPTIWAWRRIPIGGRRGGLPTARCAARRCRAAVPPRRQP
jgi:hypothetical protein